MLKVKQYKKKTVAHSLISFIYTPEIVIHIMSTNVTKFFLLFLNLLNPERLFKNNHNKGSYSLPFYESIVQAKNSDVLVRLVLLL